MQVTLRRVLAGLERRFGRAEAPVADAFQLVLFEQVAYLTTDERRAAAFAALTERVGLAPERILAAPHATIVEVCALGGIHAAERAERLKRSAAIVLERCDGDLAGTLARLPLQRARQLAREFDGFGEANAETLLLFAGIAVPALDSNGVRVLARLWFGGEAESYALRHRQLRARIASEGTYTVDALTRTYLALRRHGRTICRRAAPLCEACPLRAAPCAFATRVLK
jgi:endonuclease III